MNQNEIEVRQSGEVVDLMYKGKLLAIIDKDEKGIRVSLIGAGYADIVVDTEDEPCDLHITLPDWK